MHRLKTLFVVMVASLFMVGYGHSAHGASLNDDDQVMGNPSAKITVIEYASASCSHCAAFAMDVFPAFKAKYIDTGQVKYVFREVLTEPVQVAAAGFTLARCTGKQNYFKTLDGVFRAQREIYETQNLRTPLLKVALAAGMTEEQFMACLTDQSKLDELNARVERIAKAGDFNSTPTFFINGKKLVGEHSLADLDAAITAVKKSLPAAKGGKITKTASPKTESKAKR
jgi:protein-disulfide isomerase